MSNPRIFITGYYGFRNLGDEAVLEAILGDFRGRVADPIFIVTSGDPGRTRADHGVEAVHWRDVPAIVAAVSDADLVVIGGGGLFHDHWGIDPDSLLARHYYGIPFFATPAILAALQDTPILIYGVGVGPLFSDEARSMTRAVFDLAWAATVRDEESLEEAERLGLSRGRVELAADPAFALPPPSEADIRAAEAKIGTAASPGPPLLGVCVRGWDLGVAEETWLAAVAGGAQAFLDEHGGGLVAVPFQDLEEDLGDDADVARRLVEAIGKPERAVVTRVPETPAEALALLGRCDLVVGMRLHSVLFAALSGVPVVALSYDPKVERLMSRLDSAELSLQLTEVTAETLHRRMNAAYSGRVETAQRLAGAAASLAASAGRSADLAAALLEGRGSRPAPQPETREVIEKALLGAVLRADKKGQEATKLVTHRDWLIKERNTLEGAVKEVSAERDGFRTERDGIRAERDDLLAERNELATAAEGLENAFAELQRDHQELADGHSRLAEVHRQITTSRAYGLMASWWGIRDRARSALRFSSRSGTDGEAPEKRARRGGPGGRSTSMTWHAYAFDRFKRERAAVAGKSLAAVGSPGVRGLVSVVLPVFNGAEMVRESLDSILGQTYADFEVIAIDDGSTDRTGEILEDYAGRDDRIRVVHQENRKIPRTLSRGFRMARGEFFTWTSADNRFKPEFLEKMVACFDRHPGWDLIYANVDIIGEDGSPLRNSDWYRGYQRPEGSEHVYLPSDPSELNVWPNNLVGAAFLYRSRVAWLLGDYSPLRFTTEDYDYWMRVNSALTLRHADFSEPVYDYRFHSSSLTARDEELGITSGRDELMVFDDFRRDFLLTPVLWQIEGVGDGARPLVEELSERVRAAKHMLMESDRADLESWPRLFLTSVAVRIVANGEAAGRPPEACPPGCLKVLAVTGDGNLPAVDEGASEGWDLCLRVGGNDDGPVHPYREWLPVDDVDALFQAAEIRARSEQLRAVEEAIDESGSPAPLDATIVICTHKAIGPLRPSVLAAVRQDYEPERYEVLLVNNNPDDESLGAEIEALRREAEGERPGILRVVHCPIPGLSHARNAAIGNAGGDLLLFLDDDAVARETFVPEAVRLFREHGEAGIIGGHIRLVPPEKKPDVLQPGWERYWSQRITSATAYHEVEEWWEWPWGASWCARRGVLLAIGGFRSRYGRVGNDFSGGEEVIAASLAQKLGSRIAVAPELEVEHHVVDSRYTWRHVRQTIVSGTLVNYQAQRDLYLPMCGGPWSTLNNILSPSYDRTVGADSLRARLRHWSYRKEAWMRLLVRQVKDRSGRARRPLAASND